MNQYALVHSILVTCSLAGIACSNASPGSSDSEPDIIPITTDGGNQTDGADAFDSEERNPNGYPYPTTKLGTRPLSGATRGERIPNFKWTGYKAGSTSAERVKLVDFYKPTAVQELLILVTDVATSPMNRGMHDAWSTADLTDVTYLSVLGEGSKPSVVISEKDLLDWHLVANKKLTTVSDGGWSVLRTGKFDTSIAPLVIVLDPRSMEILYNQAGIVDRPKAFIAEQRKRLPPSALKSQ